MHSLYSTSDLTLHPLQVIRRCSYRRPFSPRPTTHLFITCYCRGVGGRGGPKGFACGSMVAEAKLCICTECKRKALRARCWTAAVLGSHCVGLIRQRLTLAFTLFYLVSPLVSPSEGLCETPCNTHMYTLHMHMFEVSGYNLLLLNTGIHTVLSTVSF